MSPANPLRGEAEATVGDVTIIMAATMEGLAALSAATGHPTFPELYRRLAGSEPATTIAAVNLLTVRGRDAAGKALKAREAAAAALARLDITRLLALQAAFLALLSALTDDAEDRERGNGAPATPTS